MIHCHFCGSDAVSQHSSMETYQYKQQAYEVLVDYSVCNQCSEEVITTEQIHINEARVREAKKKLDGLLSCEEIRDIRTRLGLTQEEAAKIFGGGVNAFSKYERGEVTQSAAMDKLIRVAAENSFVVSRLEEMAGISRARKITLPIAHSVPTLKSFATKSKGRTLAYCSNDNAYSLNSVDKQEKFKLHVVKAA